MWDVGAFFAHVDVSSKVLSLFYLGIEFAFEAELTGVIVAIEIAFKLNRNSGWNQTPNMR